MCSLLFLAVFSSVAVRAQTLVYGYSDYWGVNGFTLAPYLPDTQLHISHTNNQVSVSWPVWITNAAVLQGTTNLSPGSDWTTLPNQPVESAVYFGSGVYYPHTMTLPAHLDQQYFRLAGAGTVRLPVFSFAIFHNDQLEFTQTASLTVRGRVHANGSICLGAALTQVLRFTEAVTTASSLVYSNMGGYSQFELPIYEGSPTNRSGTPLLRLSIGTNNTPAALREIINLPPAGEDPNSLMGQQRYYNKASLVLIVSNTTVSLMVKYPMSSSGVITNVSYNSASPSAVERTNLARAFPFLTVTNRFFDYRESKRVMPTEINIGTLKNWLLTNAFVLSHYPLGSGSYPNIMYVADLRTVTNLHAVRVANGTTIPTNGPSVLQATGFTLATPNPIYVWGNYNCPNFAHQSTTNTTATFPASLVGDAVTILSPSWTDSVYGNGATALISRDAVNTTVNAAIIAGTVYTTGPAIGQFSGGINNLPRLLEDWSGRILTLNTSIVNLYDSAKATNQFQNPGNYYNAPTRNFNFNQNFLSQFKLPPGTPLVSGIVPPN